jgi:hypothetical protein
MNKTNIFITKVIKKHGNKYDYSKVNYINIRTKIIIICKIHGEFEQTPKNHLIGQGCKKCGKTCSYNTEEYIKQAINIHDNTYDYSKVNYINSRTKIIIICNIHGEFYQIPNNHLQGHGCKKCGIISSSIIKKMLKNIEFITNAITIHGGIYDYSKVKYINQYNEIIIICNIHDEFKQLPNDHLQGWSCPKCNIIDWVDV